MRETTTDDLGRRRLKFQCLYSGHDRETAKEIYVWAIAKGMKVKCYEGDELDHIVDILS